MHIQEAAHTELGGHLKSDHRAYQKMSILFVSTVVCALWHFHILRFENPPAPTVTDPHSLSFSLGELIEIKEQSYLCPSCSPSRQMHLVDDT